MKKNILIILGASLYFFLQTGMVYAATYEYDDLGRVTKAVYEDGSSVTYVYDANGNMVETVTVSAEGDINEGGQSGGQDNPEENDDAHDDPLDRNREDKENAGEDSGKENGGRDQEETAGQDNEKTAGEDDEETNGEKEEFDGEERNKENETESREENIIGAFIAAMGLIGAFLWKKHKKETGSKETEPKETQLHTSEKGRE